jgi:prepilin-type N-terminal cleavage/methylation domain-containing protein
MKLGRFESMKISLPVSSPPAPDTARARPATVPRFPEPSAHREAGFTLTEIVVAVAIIALTFGVVVFGYLRTADRAEWSSYSLAAQSLAMQGVEQARAAKWDPRAWPAVDDLGVTNFDRVEELSVPVAGEPVMGTNFISITTVSVNPPLRELRADCVWSLKSRPARISGPFTNTAVTLRAPDQ